MFVIASTSSHLFREFACCVYTRALVCTFTIWRVCILVCHGVHVVVRGQLVSSFLLPRGFWGLNSGCWQAWWQVHLPTAIFSSPISHNLRVSFSNVSFGFKFLRSKQTLESWVEMESGDSPPPNTLHSSEQAYDHIVRRPSIFLHRVLLFSVCMSCTSFILLLRGFMLL